MERLRPTAIGDAQCFQRSAAVVSMAIAVTMLIGLAAGIDILIRWIPSSTSMNPITAILLVLGAGVLLLPADRQRRALPLVGMVMMLAGSAKLGQVALGRPLGFDQLLALAVKQSDAVLPDPLALNTAGAFILLGGALLIGRTKHPARAIVGQIFVILAIAIAVMALAGFALNSATINKLTFNRMAVNTAVGLAALGMAVMTLNPAFGVMRLLLSKGPSGDLARKALPICLVTPILLGVLRLSIEHRLGLTTGDGVAMMVAGNIALSLGLLWGSLILLMKSDAELRTKAVALSVSEDQYRQAGRVGKMGHWHYDCVTDRLHWTNEFRALLGIPAGVTPSFEAMTNRIHPADRDEAREIMQRALVAGNDWNWQLRLLGANGEILYAKSHGLCRGAAEGPPESVFGVLVDVSELELARKGAEAATHAQAAFLANMSHEIRTPLNGVLGFITLLLDSKLNATQRRYLSLVNESAQMLLKLLNDILDLSKVQAGQLQVCESATDLRPIIRQAARLMAPIAEQKAISLQTLIDPDFPDAVMIDGSRFRQILLNIFGNALKFTEQGSVSVRLAADHDGPGPSNIRLRVCDSGIGIAPDRLDAMFLPFAQADSSTSRRFGGSGLGLSISRQLADLMGGTLTLQSIEGVGTTVELNLPLVPADAPAQASHDSTASRAAGGDEGVGALIAAARARPGKAILVVEDVELNRLLIEEMLTRLGHQVEFALNGAEAVTRAKQLLADPGAWDMILMDVQMPVMNGTDAARAIRRLGGAAVTIPIIALSANAFETEIQQSRDAGMNDHLVKPIDFGLLSQTIDAWTNRQPAAVRRFGSA